MDLFSPFLPPPFLAYCDVLCIGSLSQHFSPLPSRSVEFHRDISALREATVRSRPAICGSSSSYVPYNGGEVLAEVEHRRLDLLVALAHSLERPAHHLVLAEHLSVQLASPLSCDV